MSVELTVERLLPTAAHRHFVRAIGCPSSLTGLGLAVRNTLPCIRAAADAIGQVPYAAWMESIDELHELLVAAAASQPVLLTTSAKDATTVSYRAFLEPLISTLPEDIALTVKAELARALLAFASNSLPAPRTLVQGFISTLRAGRTWSRAAKSWQGLAQNFPRTLEEVKARQKNAHRSDVKAFLARLAWSHTLAPCSPSDLEARSRVAIDDRAHAGEQVEEEKGAGDDTGFLNTEDEQDPPKFEGNFIGWLIAAGKGAGYRYRFGVEGHWDRQTLAELQHVCAAIRKALRGRGRQRAYAYLAQISLLTSLPADIAIDIPIGPTDDVFLPHDLRAIGVHLPRVLGRRRHETRARDAVDATQDVLIPQSKEAVEVGEDLRRQHPEPHSVIELLIGTDEEWAVDEFLRDYQAWLKRLGLGWMHGVRWARFAKSFSQVYRSQASDVVAALLGLDFREASIGMLHYVALPTSYVNEQVALAYERVGWGPPVELHGPTVLIGSRHALAKDQFAAALSDLSAVSERMRTQVIEATDPEALVSHFNELVHIRQLEVITLMAGRGNHIESLTWYALYGHGDYVMLGDKYTDAHSRHRLIPVHHLLREALAQYINDVDAFVATARKFSLSTVDLEERRATAPAFVTVSLTRSGNGRVVRVKPTERTRLEKLAQVHLKGPINTGRHTLISLAILEGVDGWLIKALSGHRRGSAEPFNDGGAVSPRHGLCLLRSALHWTLKDVPTHSSAAGTEGRFVLPLSELPLSSRSLRGKFGRASREHVLGPPCELHTLTALRLIEHVGHLLVAGGGRARADADLLLCAMVLNWVERQDLQAWWQQQPFRSICGGVPIAVWRRENKPGELVRPLEAPTALALLRVQRELEGRLPPWSDTCDAVASWLRDAVPEVTWPTSSSSAVAALDGLMQRWMRVQAPPFILTAASPWLKSATANRTSILRLAGDAPGTAVADESLPTVELPTRTQRRARAQPSVMKDVMTLIHKFGSREKRIGEDQQRWRDLLREVAKIDCQGDTRARAICEWIAREAGLWLRDERIDDSPSEDDAGRIQVSSLSSYVSLLGEGLERIRPSEAIEAWGEDEWYEWVDILMATTRGNKQEERRRRAERELVAAHRFLRALSKRGYPVPPSLLQHSSPEEPEAIRRAAAATLLLEADRTRILERITRHYGDCPVVGDLARLYVLLLFAAPLRSTECGVLPLGGISPFDALVIASGGWSHLKSRHARRLVPIAAALAAEIRAIAALITAAEPKARWFFLMSDQNDWSMVRALASAFVTVMRQETGDADGRLHSARTVAPLLGLLGNWEPELRSLLDGSATPKQCQSYCNRLQAAGVAHLVRVILLTGHGHPTTYLEYYFPLWPLLLSVFARASLTRFDNAVPAALCRHLPEASAALLEAQTRARDTGHPIDAWQWITVYAGSALGLKPLKQDDPTS